VNRQVKGPLAQYGAFFMGGMVVTLKGALLPRIRYKALMDF